MPAASTFVFVLFPRVTQLDFTGPYELLWRLPGARCMLVSRDGGPVEAEGGLRFDTVPIDSVERCELLLVPGGYGTVDAMGDARLLAEVRRLAAGAPRVVSVCTGSLVLAAAGLLQGRRAACHWAWRDMLAEFPGVVPDPARVVRDGPVWSGGGVTAGIDLALAIAADLAGETAAQSLQLALEYAPAPPFASGRPEDAPAEVCAMVRARMDGFAPGRTAAARRAAQALADGLA